MLRSVALLSALLFALTCVGAGEAEAGGWSWSKARRSFKKRVKEVDKAAGRLRKNRLVVKTRREFDKAGQSVRDTTRSAQRQLGFGYRTRRKPTQVVQPPTSPAAHGHEKSPVKRTQVPPCDPAKAAPC